MNHRDLVHMILQHRGWSIERLAVELGVSYHTIKAWISPATNRNARAPRAPMAAKLRKMAGQS